MSENPTLTGILARATQTPVSQATLVDHAGALELWRHGATVLTMAHDAGTGLYEATLEFEHKGVKRRFTYHGMKPVLTEARRTEISNKVNAWYEQLSDADKAKYDALYRADDFKGMHAMYGSATGISFAELQAYIAMRWNLAFQRSAALDGPD